MKFTFNRPKASPELAHQNVDTTEEAARADLVEKINSLSPTDQDALISFLGVHLPEINEGETEMLRLPDLLAKQTPGVQFKYLNRPFSFESPATIGAILTELIENNQRLIIALEALRES